MKNLKGVYFSQVETSGTGPKKKILDQIKVFEEAGVSFELVESPFQLHGLIRGNFLLRQLVCRLPFTYVYSKHHYDTRFTGADIFYVRFLAGDRYFIRFLKMLRYNNPEAHILLELPDFPTTWYMTTSVLYSLLYFPLIIKDWNARKYYKKYVDFIVLPQKREKVFGIPVIQMRNGIDVSRIKSRVPVESDVVHIIAVAGMCIFHGYDRLIEGLNNYYARDGVRNIKLHMVGGKKEKGNELIHYQTLCEKYGLKNNIIFYGKKTGEELDKIYNQCNLAVGSLGMHRIGYQTANSLKIREYLAKGLPIIAGSNVDILDNEEFPYILKFSNDDTPIDIECIIEFYDRIYQNESASKVNQVIRDFAIKNCDIRNTMHEVIEYMTGNKVEE